MVNSLDSTVSPTDIDRRTTRSGVGSYADVVERLFGEFEARYPLSVIVDLVHECRAQLTCSPETAMPELLERLARQRLGAGQARTGEVTPSVRLPGDHRGIDGFARTPQQEGPWRGMVSDEAVLLGLPGDT